MLFGAMTMMFNDDDAGDIDDGVREHIFGLKRTDGLLCW